MRAAAIPLDDGRMRALARRWYEPWNAHDLDRILSHYTADVVFTSAFIAALGSGGLPRTTTGCRRANGAMA
jgi:hypothetical protein